MCNLQNVDTSINYYVSENNSQLFYNFWCQNCSFEISEWVDSFQYELLPTVITDPV